MCADVRWRGMGRPALAEDKVLEAVAVGLLLLAEVDQELHVDPHVVLLPASHRVVVIVAT